MPKRILTGGDRVQVLALMASQIHVDRSTPVEWCAAKASELLEAVEAHELTQRGAQKVAIHEDSATCPDVQSGRNIICPTHPVEMP